MGNLRVGEPVLTTVLRGDLACIATVRTLEHPLHSRLFGGAAPDAMMALARILNSLVDIEGNVAVPGVTSGDWDGAAFSPEGLRASADLLEGSHIVGSGPIASRLWAKPSINAIGVDMTSIAGSSNVLVPEVRAKISMRIVPGSEAGRGRGLRGFHPPAPQAPGGGTAGGVHPVGSRRHRSGPHPRLRRERRPVRDREDGGRPGTPYPANGPAVVTSASGPRQLTRHPHGGE
jgi:hypothetical protein